MRYVDARDRGCAKIFCQEPSKGRIIWWFNFQIQIESQNQSACAPLPTEHFCATSIPGVHVRHFAQVCEIIMFTVMLTEKINENQWKSVKTVKSRYRQVAPLYSEVKTHTGGDIQIKICTEYHQKCEPVRFLDIFLCYQNIVDFFFDLRRLEV